MKHATQVEMTGTRWGCERSVGLGSSDQAGVKWKHLLVEQSNGQMRESVADGKEPVIGCMPTRLKYTISSEKLGWTRIKNLNWLCCE